MFDVKTLTLENAKKALQEVRLYQDMTKKLWKRGRALFHNKMDWTHTYLVEYFPAVGIEFTREKALQIYEKVWLVTPKIEEILFVPKDNLLSGVKVYFDDNCIDLSFKNIEYKLNK
jgi:hypothetical protein